jgi:hypothetical protein
MIRQIVIVCCFALQGCATAVAIVDVTASTAIYAGKTVVGVVTPNFDRK